MMMTIVVIIVPMIQPQVDALAVPIVQPQVDALAVPIVQHLVDALAVHPNAAEVVMVRVKDHAFQHVYMGVICCVKVVLIVVRLLVIMDVQVVVQEQVIVYSELKEKQWKCRR